MEDSTKKQKQCGAVAPLQHEWLCTLDAGHAGDHRVVVLGDREVARWNDNDEGTWEPVGCGSILLGLLTFVAVILLLGWTLFGK